MISYERPVLLDTNVPSETLRPIPNPRVTAWVEAHSEVQFVSVVLIGELRRGATLLVQGSARRLQLEHYIKIKIPLLFGKRIRPITQAIAERWGILDARRQSAGQPLGIADGMIAATAVEHDLTIFTRNVKDFARLGATIFNPWETSACWLELFRPCSPRGRLPIIRRHVKSAASSSVLYRPNRIVPLLGTLKMRLRGLLCGPLNESSLGCLFYVPPLPRRRRFAGEPR